MSRRGLLGSGASTGAPAIMPIAVFDEPASAIVDTKQGQLRGRRNGTVYEFRGVRYAEPQTVENRFLSPIPLKSWQGVRDALESGPASMQRWGPAGFMNAWAVQKDISEDCLRVNVWTPGLDGNKRPVMFWCHGGGFITGSGSTVAYDGKNLADFGDVVVVTVTHRLGVFGYLALVDIAGPAFAAAGNAGMLDIIEALKWVRDNIARFGGDPDNVTIFGQSGGGGKVSTLLAMPAAAGLFHKAIVESGSFNRVQTREDAARDTARLLASMGLACADAAKLRAVPAEQLLDAGLKAQIDYGPVVDGAYLPRHPFEPEAPGVSRSVPMIIGTTETELTFVASPEDFAITDADLRDRLVGEYGDGMLRVIDTYRTTYRGLSPSQLLFRIASDFGVRANAITQAEQKISQGGAPAFMYFVTWGSPIEGGKYEARHSIEVAYAFRNHRNPLVQQFLGAGPEQDRLGDQISSAWVAFARNGNPSNPVTGSWASYNLGSRPTMVFSSKTALVNDPNSTNRKLFMEMSAADAPRPTGFSLPQGRCGAMMPS
jgi:para-nitrobenzyl esterase